MLSARRMLKPIYVSYGDVAIARVNQTEHQRNSKKNVNLAE